MKEIVIKYGGGGSLSHDYNLSVYSFDSSEQKMCKIFSENISRFDYDVDSLINKANFIKFAECNDTIKVFEGIFINAPKAFINPDEKGELLKEYIFNKQKKMFEEKNS